MPNLKLKSESYKNLGGINQKVSQYQTSPLEFLDIKNFDFQKPNALSSRWGSTQYVSQNFGAPITSLFEYSRLSGASWVVIGASGSLWYGATTGQSQGMSFTLSGQTLSIPYNFWVHYWSFKQGLGGGPQTEEARTFYPGSSQYILNSGSTYSINPISVAGEYSFTVNQNELFGANGSNFFKFDGTSAKPVGLPFATAATTRSQDGFGTGLTFALYIGQTYALGSSSFAGLTTGSFYLYASYVNDRGFESQAWPVCGIDYTQYNTATNNGLTTLLNTPITTGPIYPTVTLNTPLGYGISSVNVYYYFSPTSIFLNGLSPSAYSDFNYDGFLTAWTKPYVLFGNFPASGSTITTVPFGSTTVEGHAALTKNLGLSPDPGINEHFQFGITLIAEGNQVTEISQEGYFPRMLTTFKDRMFAAGFSSTPSTVWFSDVGEPEGYTPISNFEVRSNDGDVITAVIPYMTKLFIFKKSSFHSLMGDGPQNYFLQELSTTYGCINKDCVVTYNDMILFLDQKGVMLFNGASIECLSSKLQPIFDRMNFAAAQTEACAVHDMLRNQVLFAIPVDGSETNNITVVYDYLVQSWTTYEGVDRITTLARIQGRNNLKSVFYGTASGIVNWYGPSFFSDNGNGFTSYFKTRFNSDLGQSVEKQYRRLYVNVEPNGVNYEMPLHFYQDYGVSPTYSVTFSTLEFQNRIDFGIPAKSLSFELYNMRTDSPLRIYGFTLEHRMQRRV